MNSAEAIGRNFNLRASTYEASAKVQREAAKWLGDWIERDLPAEMSMWELGSGTGFFTKEILKRGYKILATDIAPEMVARGRIECPEAEWTIFNGWELPENVCDRIFSSSLLQWMPEPTTTLKTFYRALRARGKMLHGFFVSPTLCELYELTDDKFLPLKWHSEADWRRFFESAGFKILRTDALDKRIFYPNATEFLRILKHTGTASAPHKISPPTLRKILSEYTKRFGNASGEVFATWRFVRLEAEKI